MTTSFWGSKYAARVPSFPGPTVDPQVNDETFPKAVSCQEKGRRLHDDNPHPSPQAAQAGTFQGVGTADR